MMHNIQPSTQHVTYQEGQGGQTRGSRGLVSHHPWSGWRRQGKANRRGQEGQGVGWGEEGTGNQTRRQRGGSILDDNALCRCVS